jgi:tRNA(Ile)-lysidine synthase
MAATRNRTSASLAGRVGAFLTDRCKPGARLAVGLSGGCDSVVLLHIVTHLAGRGPLRAIHVHHGLSANADAWSAFCAEFCAGLGVDLDVSRVVVDRSGGEGIEAAARVARYQAFADLDVDGLLLGHHRGDQAETLLFNLLRGTGVVGAAAIPVERRQGGLPILRPLLDVSREEIEAYARAHRLRWIDDESNADTALSRNFLRHEVFPLLAERFPGVERNLAQAALYFGEAAELLDQLGATDWQAVADGEALPLAALREMAPARLRNLLRWRLRHLGWRAPAAARLEEFSRQLQHAAADRHPELQLAEGRMVAGKRRLRWVAVE